MERGFKEPLPGLRPVAQLLLLWSLWESPSRRGGLWVLGYGGGRGPKLGKEEDPGINLLLPSPNISLCLMSPWPICTTSRKLPWLLHDLRQPLCPASTWGSLATQGSL